MLVNSILVCAFNVPAAEELELRWKERRIIKPSSLQRDVIDGIIWEDYNIITGAVAGSGKTSLLMSLLEYLVDFNDITEDPVILNVHKIATRGNVLSSAIGKFRTNKFKYDNLFGKKKDGEYYNEFYLELEKRCNGSIPNYWELRNSIFKIIDLCRLTLTDIFDPDQIISLASFYNIEFGDCPLMVGKFISQTLIKGIKELNSNSLKEVDLTDLIYLPVYVSQNRGFSHEFKFDLIIVDECQDLSKCQLELIKLCSHEHTRYLFVGDPRQAIYGFAGADCNSFDLIKANLNCVYYPLSVNYRCPKSVLELAKVYCPEIQPCEIAPEGKIEYIDTQDIPKLANPGDMIISRLTAPLISLAIKTIKLKKPATVKGRDLGKQLCDLIVNISNSKEFEYKDFIAYSDNYFNGKIDRLTDQSGSESKIDILKDQKEAIESCYTEFVDATDIKQLCNMIEGIFDKSNATILYQTIHRCKGSEANVVYIVDYNKLPMVKSYQTDDQAKQERNLTYVAITRCKFDLNDPGSGKLYLSSSK